MNPHLGPDQASAVWDRARLVADVSRHPLSETYAKVSLSCAKLTPAVRFLLL
jgi:hypothetical protein